MRANSSTLELFIVRNVTFLDSAISFASVLRTQTQGASSCASISVHWSSERVGANSKKDREEGGEGG